jgi:hypothetical protein
VKWVSFKVDCIIIGLMRDLCIKKVPSKDEELLKEKKLSKRRSVVPLVDQIAKLCKFTAQCATFQFHSIKDCNKLNCELKRGAACNSLLLLSLSLPFFH